MAKDRGYFRHVGRRYERCGARRWLDRRRGCRCARGAGWFVGIAWPVPRCSAPCSARRSIGSWGRWALDASPTFIGFDLMAQGCATPYDLNPGGFHPLESILADSIDFGRLARSPHQAVYHGDQCAHRPPATSFGMARSPRTFCSRQAACRPFSGRSRSMARPIGMAVMRQCHDHPSHQRERGAGYDPCPDQSSRTTRYAALRERDTQPPE